MPTYKLSRSARNDIAAIADYTIATFGVDQALAYRDSLMETFEMLARFPRAARERLEIDPPVRAHPHKSHMIIYIIDDDDVLILGVRHGREDWVSQLVQP